MKSGKITGSKMIEPSRLDVRKYLFSQRAINVWNNLYNDCVHASSVSVFKNRIDNYCQGRVTRTII